MENDGWILKLLMALVRHLKCCILKPDENT